MLYEATANTRLAQHKDWKQGGTASLVSNPPISTSHYLHTKTTMLFFFHLVSLCVCVIMAVAGTTTEVFIVPLTDLITAMMSEPSKKLYELKTRVQTHLTPLWPDLASQRFYRCVVML